VARRNTGRKGRRQVNSELDARIGAIIKHRRRELGWSQHVLGEKLDLTFQQIQKYEKGANQLSVARLLQLCDALDVPLTYFVGDTQVPAIHRLDYQTIQALGTITDERVKLALMRLARECARSAEQH